MSFMKLKARLVFSLFHFCLETKVEQKFKPKCQPSIDFFAQGLAYVANQLRVHSILAEATALGKYMRFSFSSKALHFEVVSTCGLNLPAPNFHKEGNALCSNLNLLE
ncbi:MAG TPA: hypothetical protein PKN75_14585 [Bacteroidia bacterium]|nr:hypothetical protein [Bacteroidia bacterium]HNU34812.1 hypothetical protein [Bacteroidia bacterium]